MSEDEQRDDHGRWTTGGSHADFKETFERLGGGTVKPGAKYGDHQDFRVGVGAYAGLGNSFQVNEILRMGFEPKDMTEYGGGINRKIVDDLTKDIHDAPRLAEPVEALRFVKPDFAEKLKVGDTFTDKGFVSTTLSPKTVSDHMERVTAQAGATMHMHLPAGTEAAVVKGSSEYELILQRGGEYRVTGVKDIAGSHSAHWTNKRIDVELVHGPR